MLQTMKALLRSRGDGVLCTAAHGRPHCSLMSYVTDPSCDTVIMATLRHSTKFENMVQNPRVSLLVDTREGRKPGGHEPVQALTVAGEVGMEADEPRDAESRARLLERHPLVRPILEHPDSVLLYVRIESFLLLDGPTRASFETNPAGRRASESS